MTEVVNLVSDDETIGPESDEETVDLVSEEEEEEEEVDDYDDGWIVHDTDEEETDEETEDEYSGDTEEEAEVAEPPMKKMKPDEEPNLAEPPDSTWVKFLNYLHDKFPELSSDSPSRDERSVAQGGE
jgi:hypothetical protein